MKVWALGSLWRSEILFFDAFKKRCVKRKKKRRGDALGKTYRGDDDVSNIIWRLPSVDQFNQIHLPYLKWMVTLKKSLFKDTPEWIESLDQGNMTKG